MIEKKQLKIELTGKDAEKIVSDWVSVNMLEKGYKLDYCRNEEGPWPSTLWIGEEKPNV